MTTGETMLLLWLFTHLVAVWGWFVWSITVNWEDE